MEVNVKELQSKLFEMGYLTPSPKVQKARDGYEIMGTTNLWFIMMQHLCKVNTTISEKIITIKIITPEQIMNYLEKNKNKTLKKSYYERRKIYANRKNDIRDAKQNGVSE
jgi:hypothetical protein